MEINTIDEVIFKAIEEVRNRKHQRPDKESITRFLTSGKGLDFIVPFLLNSIDKLLANGSIVIKKQNGKDSFYQSDDISSHPENVSVDDLDDSDDDLEITFANETTQTNPMPPCDGRLEMIKSFGQMAESVNSLNSLIQQEREKSGSLLYENFSLMQRNQELEVKIENLLASQKQSEGSQSTRAITIRSDLIQTAEKKHKEANKESLSNNETSNKENQEHEQKNKAMNRLDEQQQTSNTGKTSNVNKRKNRGKNQPNKQAIKSGGTQRGNSKAEAQNTEKIQVLIVGDSQLRNVKGEKLSNDNRDIEIRCKPGLRIEQTSAQVGKTDSDVIVVHVGTNNVKSYSPQKLANEIGNTLEKIQTDNPSAKIAFSSIFKRKDDQSLNTIIQKVNDLVAEALGLKGMDFIENKNIIYSNLATDGLHLNNGGVRRFSGNLSSFVKYC